MTLQPIPDETGTIFAWQTNQKSDDSIYGPDFWHVSHEPMTELQNRPKREPHCNFRNKLFLRSCFVRLFKG